MAVPARWMRFELADAGGLQGVCVALAALQHPHSQPILAWSAARASFGLIAPGKFAPGRRWRWPAWALAPVIATYRQLGVAAYFDADAVWLHGRRIAGCDATAIDACVVACSRFETGLAPGGALEALFRVRLEAQHGWQFDNAWPDPAERAVLAAEPAAAPAC